MKQFQFEVLNINSLKKEFAKIKRSYRQETYANVVFQIFASGSDERELKEVVALIDTEFPAANYYGCTTYGNIFEGKLSEQNTLVTCSIYEEETTRTEILVISPNQEESTFRDLASLWKYCNSSLWVKSVELLSSFKGAESLEIGKPIGNLREDVIVFGGVAINSSDMSNAETYVFAKGHAPTDKGVIAVLTGGEDLHIQCDYVCGWEGLGKNFTITKCDGKRVQEIDEAPAIDIYQKYLDVKEDGDFTKYIMMFPFLVERGGLECLQDPFPCENEEELDLCVAVEPGTKVRLSYGDKATILNHIREKIPDMVTFAPEVMHVYSCGMRRNFWGDEDISKETSIFNLVAPSNGFYTRGEILRVGNFLHYFNATIVYAMIREGKAKVQKNSLDKILNQIEIRSSLASKLITYLGAVTGELEENYSRIMNEQEAILKLEAFTDELTGLFNRRAYEADKKKYRVDDHNFVIALMDLNGLKAANDLVGHDAGDELLIGAANCLKQCFGPYGQVYRIGGDEFAAIYYANEYRIQKINADLEEETANWEGKRIGNLSISVGWVSTREFPEKSFEELEKIADQRMYDVKKAYYLNKGVNRNGQKLAYDAICDSYTKILKVNLTKDFYEIIKAEESELNQESGYEKESIAKWLYKFGVSGQVHEADLEKYLAHTSLEYLRDYFSKGQARFSLQYRRKIGEEYKTVLMEMILSSGQEEDLIVFLYVKNIEG